MESIAPLYGSKSFDYFTNVRKDILPLFPERQVDRVLEVGCGRGDTLAYLKREGRCRRTCGVELFPDAAAAARDRVDEVYAGSIESLELPVAPGSVDVVLCLDVLEHLVDPWTVAARLAGLLRPGGVMIASIPNARHFRVSLALLLGGRWEYADSGLMDRTHLRFFTRRSAVALLEGAGLRVDRVEHTGMAAGQRSRWVNAVTLGIFEPFFVFQYVLRGSRR